MFFRWTTSYSFKRCLLLNVLSHPSCGHINCRLFSWLNRWYSSLFCRANVKLHCLNVNSPVKWIVKYYKKIFKIFLNWSLVITIIDGVEYTLIFFCFSKNMFFSEKFLHYNRIIEDSTPFGPILFGPISFGPISFDPKML